MRKNVKSLIKRVGVKCKKRSYLTWVSELLEVESKIYRHGTGRTMIYLPAGLVRDSQFPFKPGERVKLVVDPKKRELIVKKLS